MSDDDLIDECIRSLAKIHNMEYDIVKKMYLKGVVKKWDLDEFTLGAFTVFEPYQVNCLKKTSQQYSVKTWTLVSVFRN